MLLNVFHKILGLGFITYHDASIAGSDIAAAYNIKKRHSRIKYANSDMNRMQSAL